MAKFCCKKAAFRIGKTVFFESSAIYDRPLQEGRGTRSGADAYTAEINVKRKPCNARLSFVSCANRINGLRKIIVFYALLRMITAAPITAATARTMMAAMPNVGGRRRRGRISRSAGSTRRNVGRRVGQADLGGSVGSAGIQRLNIAIHVFNGDVELLSQSLVIIDGYLQLVAVFRIVSNLEGDGQNDVAVCLSSIGSTHKAKVICVILGRILTARAFPSIRRFCTEVCKERIFYIGRFGNDRNEIIAVGHEHRYHQNGFVFGQTFQRDSNINLVAGFTLGDYDIPAKVSLDFGSILGDGDVCESKRGKNTAVLVRSVREGIIFGLFILRVDEAFVNFVLFLVNAGVRRGEGKRKIKAVACDAEIASAMAASPA